MPLKIAISQPTYLPWMGYFDLIDQVDVFVLLDNVQFAKQSWQQRNRIRTAAGLQWLTVPVKLHFGQLIQEVEVREPDFHVNHLRAIELAYRRAPNFERFFPQLSERLTSCPRALLVDLNVALMTGLMEILGIRTLLLRASTLGQAGKRTELLANLCAKLGATQYISPAGSAAYLIPERHLLTDRRVEVLFHNYEHPVYRQRHKPFTPFASVIDLIFNEGDASLNIIRSGRKQSYSVDDARALQAQSDTQLAI